MKKLLILSFIFFIFPKFSLGEQLHGSTKNFPKKAPQLKGVVTDNEKYFDFNQFKGKILLVTYGYTSCPHVCPTIMSYLKEIETELNSKGLKGKYGIVFITVDPKEDTAKKLREYKKEVGVEDFIFVTGSEENLKKVWQALDVFVKDKGYMEMKHGEHIMRHRMIDHTAKLTVIDKKGYIREEFLGMYLPVEQIVEDVILLLQE
ncbi:SCO family protein [Persephonella sp.]